MGSLSRRVGALEAIAEEVRHRPYRKMAAAYGVPVQELLAEVESGACFINRLKAQGLSLDEIMRRSAAEAGISLEELERELAEIEERYFR